MTKIEAIEYLDKHSVYNNEWQGTGMWEAVMKVLNYEAEPTKEYMDQLLKEAEAR
jgi:hypothetical protein